MGTDRTPSVGLSGFAVQDARLTNANIAAQGVTATSSTFTQASPRVGVPVAATSDTDAVLHASGSQSASGSLEILCREAGMPGRATFTYRDITGGDTTSEYKGRNGYQCAMNWEPLRYTTAAGTTTAHLCAAELSTGELLVAGDHYGASNSPTLYRYDRTTAAWTTLSPTLTDTNSDLGPALVPMPDGSVLMYYAANVQALAPYNLHCFRSTDKGATWTLVARNVLGANGILTSVNVMRTKSAAYANGQVLLAVAWNVIAGPRYTMSIYASSDGGMSFERTVADWQTTYNERAQRPQVVAHRGSFVLGYYADPGVLGAAEDCRVRRFPTAFSTPSGAVTMHADVAVYTDTPSLAMFRDEDDTIYTIVRGAAIGGYNKVVIVLSLDGGVTWSPGYGSGWLTVFQADNAAADGDLTYFTAAAVGGRAALITRWTAATAALDPQSIGVLWLGGYSSWTWPLRKWYTGTDFEGVGQCAWGGYAIGAYSGGYVAVDEPQGLGWTAGGTGTDADDAIATGTGVLRINTVASGASRYYSRTADLSASSPTGGVALVDLTINDNYGTLAGGEIAFNLRVSDGTGAVIGTWTSHVQLRFARVAGVLSYRLMDVTLAAQIGSDVTVGSVTRVRVAVAVSSGGFANTWYSTDGAAHQETWTESAAAGVIDNTPAINLAYIQFGVAVASATIVDWRMVRYSFDVSTWRIGGSESALGNAGLWANPADVVGRSLASSPVSVYDGVKIAMQRGPARIGDTWTISARYDYAVSNLSPFIHPSPQITWRGTVATEEKIVWGWSPSSLYAQRFHNFTVVVGIFNSNLLSAVLEGYDGAAWNTIATVDTSVGFSGMSYASAGGCLSVLAGSTAAGRALHYDELTGSQIHLTDGATTTYHTLAGNSEGTWKESMTVKQPLIYLADPTGSEAANGTMVIRARNSVTFAPNITATSYRYIRLRIPAQTTADGYFRIGTLFVGALVAFGARYSFGWSVEPEANTDLLPRPSGLTRSYVAGPPRRIWTVGWDDALLQQDVLQASPDPAFVRNTSAGSIVANRNDTLHLVPDLFRAMNGAGQPLLWLPHVPTAAGTVTDPERFALVRVVSNPRREDVRGAFHGTNSMARMGNITLREEV
jgi:hypothetical protein